MAELQYVPINQAVLPPFYAYGPACLLSHLFKLKIFLNLNVGEHPFPVYWPDCYLPCYTICLYFYVQTCCKNYLSKIWKNLLLLLFSKPKKYERQIIKTEVFTPVVFDTVSLFCVCAPFFTLF